MVGLTVNQRTDRLSNSTIKVITLAKQLKVTFAHLKDYLKAEGFEVPASPNANLTEEVYLKVLEHRAPDLHREALAAKAPPVPAAEVGADIRRAQVETILHPDTEPEPERFESERLETLKKLKVISSPEPAPVEPEPVAPAAPEAPVVEEPVTAGETVAIVEPEVVAPAPVQPEPAPEPVAPVVPAKPAGRLPFGSGSGEKIGLPVFTASKVLGYHHEPEPVKAAPPAAKPVRGRKDPAPAAPGTDVIPGPPPRTWTRRAASAAPNAPRRKRSASSASNTSAPCRPRRVVAVPRTRSARRARRRRSISARS
jgi:hypothetical protein